MKTLITIIFLSLLSSSCSVPDDDLVYRDGLYYKKFSEIPFSGKVTGLRNGLMKNGKEDGEWVINHENGQLLTKGNYENGKEEDEWVSYWDDGQLWSKGNYKNGKREGEWVGYHPSGQLNYKGNYKNGKEKGEWVSYWDYLPYSEFRSKGNYKNGKKEGAWVGYDKDGTLDKEVTGTYKNGVKITDW